MIPNGTIKVICSDCGKKFTIVKTDEILDPNYCISCKLPINYLKDSADGTRIIAFVKEH